MLGFAAKFGLCADFMLGSSFFACRQLETTAAKYKEFIRPRPGGKPKQRW